MKYNASLDGLRALAALVVVGYHAEIPGLVGGFMGVDIFFVLSGYLITRLLLDEYQALHTVRLGSFWGRRLRRLYPALIVMLFFYLILASIAFPESSINRHLRDVIWTGLYISNYSSTFSVPMADLGHVWSLAVEVQFYLLWPFVLLLIMLLPKLAGVTALVGLYLLATWARWWGTENLPDGWDFYVRTEMHCSGLILGSVVGYLNLRLHRYFSVAGILILAFALTFFSSRWDVTAKYGFLVAEFGTLILLASQPGWLGGHTLSWLGRMSYGLYLWHYPIMRFLHKNHCQWFEVLIVGVSVGLLAAVLSYYMIERRFYNSRFERTKSPMVSIAFPDDSHVAREQKNDRF